MSAPSVGAIASDANPDTLQEYIAHVDVNSYYVSCERVFDPKLDNRPVIVLCVRLDSDHMVIRNRFVSARW